VISPDDVPQEARAVIRSLIPSAAIDWVIRPHSRDPGSLYWRQTVVQEATAQRLLGFAPPVLASLRSEDVVEYLSLHEGMAALEGAGTRPTPRDVRYRASYLPVGLPWLQATRTSVLDGATLLTWSAEHPEPVGEGDSSWPQRLASAKADRHHEDEQLGRDFAVIGVGEVRLGVQVSGSGLVCLTWRVRCGEGWCRASVMTRCDPLAAVELVLRDGLLSAR